MGQDSSAVDTFEETTERGRKLVSAAREEYDTLQNSEEVPAQLIEALTDVERELEEIDKTLNIAEEDLRRAEELTDRAALLVETFSALRQHQRIVIEGDTAQLREYADAIRTLSEQSQITVDSDLADIEKRCSLCERLIDRERHYQVRSSERVSLADIDTSIRQVVGELAESADPSLVTKVYHDLATDILENIHDSLKQLNDDNPDRTAFSTDLSKVKGELDTIDETPSSEWGDGTATTARIAVEGCLMLQYQVTRARAEQQLAVELGQKIRETALTIECDVDSCVSRGDTETLLSAVTDAVTSHAEQTNSDRIRHLLQDYDGDVIQIAQASQFSVEKILDEIAELHEDGQIAGIDVEIES